MIRIKIKEKPSGITISANGHANYNPGNDIVCSAVSALFYAFGAYVTSTAGVECECKFGDGYSMIKCTEGVDEAFKMFELGLRMIEAEYGDCVKVEKVV